MDLVLKFLNSIASYANWVIAYHLKDYLFFAAGFVLICLLFLVVVRSKAMYIFPIIFFLITAILLIMSAAGAANFEWDYMLLLAFINLAVGYILYVLVSMVLSRPQI